MGYTHNWYGPQNIAASTFNAITEDFQKLLPSLEAAGSPVSHAYGLEEPEFTPEYIRFNGVRHCGHAKNPEIQLPWLHKDATGMVTTPAPPVAHSHTAPVTVTAFMSPSGLVAVKKMTTETRTDFVEGFARQAFGPTILP